MFRFTIRDLLWLTVVVAVALALYTAQRSEKDELESRLTQTQVKAATAELAAQANYVEYKKILGLIEQSGQSLIWHPDGTTTLEKIKNPNYDTTSDRDHLTEQMKVDSIRYQR